MTAAAALQMSGNVHAFARASVPKVLLDLTGIAKSYGRLEVIRSIDLKVHEGEVLGLIGPNGAGKSTLFNLIAGVAAPTRGRMTFSGSEFGQMNAPARARLGIGRTYQIPMPFRKMSVFENLLAASVHGGGLKIAEGRTLCLEVLTSTGLLHRQAQMAGSLTLLDLKRLELARALCLRPRLLLLDEVAGGLTDGECDELVGLIRSIHATGVTIIWVEHVLNALRRVATRMAMLAEGRILSEGICDEVLSDPAVRTAYLGT